MPNLPIFKDPSQNLMLLQNSWKAALMPIIGNEINQGILLTGHQLSSGNNVINHLLGRKMIGWIITDINASVAIYRSAALNDKTLTLNASATCTVSLWVF